MAKLPMTVSIPEGEEYGLQRMAMEALHAPRRLQVALVVYDCAEIKQDLDTGALIPKLRAIRILPLMGDDLDKAQELFDSADMKINGSRIHEREQYQVKRVENAFTNPYKVTDEGEEIPYYDKRFASTPGVVYYATAQPILTWRYDSVVAERQKKSESE